MLVVFKSSRGHQTMQWTKYLCIWFYFLQDFLHLRIEEYMLCESRSQNFIYLQSANIESGGKLPLWHRSWNHQKVGCAQKSPTLNYYYRRKSRQEVTWGKLWCPKALCKLNCFVFEVWTDFWVRNATAGGHAGRWLQLPPPFHLVKLLPS